MMVYKGNLGKDGQTSGIIGHAGQLPYTLPESLNVSLPVKPTFKCSFLFIHPLGNNYWCCHLTAGPLPIHWVRPYIMLLLLPRSWPLTHPLGKTIYHVAAAASQLVVYPTTG